MTNIYTGNLKPSSGNGGIASVTPRFSVNTGNTNNQGLMDVLSYSGSSLSFKVDDGTNYKPLVCTDGYIGEQFEKTELNTVTTSNLSAGTYNCFIPKTGNQPYLLNNTIFVQAEKPSDAPVDTIPNMTSNTTPYGAITWKYNGAPSNSYSRIDLSASNLFYAFKEGYNPSIYVPDISDGTYYRSVDFPFTYTYDSNYQPVAGRYQFKYTKNPNYACDIRTIVINYKDGTNTTITRNSSGSFTQTIIASSNIISIDIRVRSTNYGNNNRIGTFQLLKPAILDEGTLWVNNGVEPLEVMARDENSQWQPFYDVLAGTVTVNSSHNITAVNNIGFNYYSTINMHNISTTAHTDIRSVNKEQDITLISLQSQINSLINRLATAEGKIATLEGYHSEE